MSRHRTSRRLGAALGAAVTVLLAAACSNPTGPNGSGSGTKIAAVGAENEYANVISQIGGQYVSVKAIMSNPNTDPHTFQADPQVAQAVSAARLIVQNGLGYDTFMDKIEQGSGRPNRQVIVVQKLLGLPNSTPNPHLWYKPSTMPAVAKAIADDLSTEDPAHKAYFEHNLTTFDNSLKSWTQAIAELKATYPGATVATTEPVADYTLQAAGIKNLTPWAFQAAIMNGTDPAPQDVAIEKGLFTGHKVRAFIYNQQVTDSLTRSLVTLATQNNIPIVGVYETMPTGYDYQTWMNAEVSALSNAIGHHQSAPVLDR